MGAIDEIKGRLKEAAGALTGNKELKRRGKMDQVAGNAKDAFEVVRGKADDVVEYLKDKPESD